MAVHAFPQLKNPASFEYTLRKVSMKEDTVMELGQRMMLAKLQEGVLSFLYDLSCVQDTLELTIKSAKGQSTTATFVVVYSPFTDRDRQVAIQNFWLMRCKREALKKEALFKKQGGSHKSWKKRWFVLDEEKIQYFDPKKKDKALVSPFPQ